MKMAKLVSNKKDYARLNSMFCCSRSRNEAVPVAKLFWNGTPLIPFAQKISFFWNWVSELPPVPPDARFSWVTWVRGLPTTLA